MFGRQFENVLEKDQDEDIISVSKYKSPWVEQSML